MRKTFFFFFAHKFLFFSGLNSQWNAILINLLNYLTAFAIRHFQISKYAKQFKNDLMKFERKYELSQLIVQLHFEQWLLFSICKMNKNRICELVVNLWIGCALALIVKLIMSQQITLSWSVWMFCTCVLIRVLSVCVFDGCWCAHLNLTLLTAPHIWHYRDIFFVLGFVITNI